MYIIHCISISTNTKQAGLRGVCPSLGRSWARDRVFYANIRPINTIGPTRAVAEPFPNGRPYTESQNPGIQYNMHGSNPGIQYLYNMHASLCYRDRNFGIIGMIFSVFSSQKGARGFSGRKCMSCQ